MTVAVAGLHIRGLIVITALAIATTKASIVLNYFMHIKWESRVFKVFIAVCLIIFAVMVILTFFDLTYRPTIK